MFLVFSSEEELFGSFIGFFRLRNIKSVQVGLFLCTLGDTGQDQFYCIGTASDDLENTKK